MNLVMTSRLQPGNIEIEPGHSAPKLTLGSVKCFPVAAQTGKRSFPRRKELPFRWEFGVVFQLPVNCVMVFSGLIQLIVRYDNYFCLGQIWRLHAY